MLADLYYRNGRLNEARTRLADLLRTNEISAQTLWLSLRIERKAGDREMEARYASQLRRNFRDSRENQLLMQGQYQ
jgi:type IV pilus assembly protein PilF